MADNLFDSDSKNKLKGPNTHQKEDEYAAKFVHPLSAMKFMMIFISIIFLCLFYVFYIRGLFHIKIPVFIYFIPAALTILSFIFLHGISVDIWVPHIASSRIGSTYCKIGLSNITLDYDVINSGKDIDKFINEITEKSEDWNYFLVKNSRRNMKIKLKVRPKVKIPTKAPFEGEIVSNEQWNYVPLGICLTDSSVLGTINWMLNDNNKVVGEHKETIPSTSFLVSGGTGSGKSVLENNIIRHCNKFNNNFQTMLIDVKRVEFGNLSNLEGIKAVALDIMEAKGCLEASREIMYSRFKFMEKTGVNNVYKLKNYQCDYFVICNIISGVKKLYQFDEIFYAKVNGEVTIATIEDLYKKIEEGTVEIYFSSQKESSNIIDTDEERCKSTGNLFIREVKPGEFYNIGGFAIAPDETCMISGNKQTPENILKAVSGKDSSVVMTLDNGEEIALTAENCRKEECIFRPKAILNIIDEMSEVMSTNNYKAQSSISDSISSIARLGRAAACHLVLAALPWDLSLTVKRTNKDGQKCLINILWQDVQLGDEFDDGSICTYIGPWSYEPCYELTSGDSTIVASYSHLFNMTILNQDGVRINSIFSKSALFRFNVNEQDDSWVCVEDIFMAITAMNCTVEINSVIDGVIQYSGNNVDSICIASSGEKTKVRCIQTNTGHYGIER